MASSSLPSSSAQAATAAALPRGIRNNNPGNLRPGPAWQGIAGLDQDQPDPPYLRFVDPEHGIRALARTLITYRDRHGIDTLAGVFERWAPAGDRNDPQAYAAAVAETLNGDPAAPVDLHDPQVLAALAEAITRQENGSTGTPWYPPEIYHRGVALALGDSPSRAAAGAAIAPPASVSAGS